MNLHAIANAAVTAVNPNQKATLLVSKGYSIDASGRQIPEYKAPQQINAQIQSVSAKDLKQAEFLNLQTIQNTMYVSGNIDGIVRAENKGGDLIRTSDGTTWLVIAVLEQWPDWVKVAVTMQTDGALK